MSLDLGIEKISRDLLEKEHELDEVLSKSRQAVRSCSNAIKCMHAKDMKSAKKHLGEAEKVLKALAPYMEKFPSQVGHLYQEYAETRITLAAIETKEIPSYTDLKVPELPYLLGLLDAVGELKREMYESLRRNKKKDAETYFSLMEEIYDTLLPLQFSNAVLPEFRKKQDSARHQIEQARGELL